MARRTSSSKARTKGFRTKRPVPFEFVLEALEDIAPFTRPMFGCTSIYAGEKIVLILREKEDHPRDNGVWLATTPEHHESLRKDFPKMRSIRMFGPGDTGWQVLPVDDPGFEEAALKACEMVIQGDPRIGKVPKRKSASKGPRRSSRDNK